MSHETGGYADKLGNRYEIRWVVFQYVQVLTGELRWVLYEPVGEDEEGVDLWLERADGLGLQQAQQCKSELAAKDSWSIADLHQKGILRHLRKQLERSDIHEYALVSATPATLFRDLTRSARDSSGDPQSFYRDQIQRRSSKHRQAFKSFCKYLGLSQDNPDDLAVAFDLLRRSGFHQFSDDAASRAHMRALVSLLVDGDPESVLSVLANFAAENLRKRVYADSILAFLRARGYEAKDLGRNQNLLPRIEELDRQFDHSMRYQLAGGRLIARSETQEVLEWIEAEGEKRLLALHGKAGLGKSGVLHELIAELGRRGIPFLALRLDQQTPLGSPHAFGKSLGLPDSPAACLRQLAGSRLAVLILDQLDALRWTSAHAASALPVCQELIEQTLASAAVKVIISCRSFDLEHDPQINAWQRTQKLERVEVGPLSVLVVREFVTSSGHSYAEMSAREQALLRSIQNLTMWSEIAQSAGAPRFSTASELSRLFWQNRRREMERRGVDFDELETVLGAVVQHMDGHSTLTAPVRLIEHNPRAVTELQSLNVMQVSNRQVSFCHQAYLDYLVAEKLLSRIDSESGSVRQWLGERPRQSLFRREQLRLVLALIREEQPTRFLETVRGLLASDAVRFHLKQLAIQVLGQIDDPNAAEAEFVETLLEHDLWRAHVLDELSSSRRWFAALDTRGLWGEWLGSDDLERVNGALRMLRSAAPERGDRVAELLAPLISRNDDWAWRCLSVLPRDPAHESPALFEIRLSLARRGYFENWYDWSGLARTNPRGLITLLAIYLDHWASLLRRKPRRTQWPELLPSVSRGKDRDTFTSTGRAEPAAAWDLLLPAVIRFLRVKRGLIAKSRRRRSTQDPSPWTWPWLPKLPRAVGEILVAAGRRLIQQDPEGVFRRADDLPHRMRAAQRIVLRSLLAGSPAVADRALEWLQEDPGRLRLGGRHSRWRWEPARRLIRRFAPHCSEMAYLRLERMLLSHHDRDEWESFRSKAELAKEGWYDSITYFGQTQYHLLPALPELRKSTEARATQGVLHRKFHGVEPFRWRARRSTAGFVGSPIPPERLSRLSDRAWLNLITGPQRSLRGLPRRRGRGHFTESTPRMFARDLQTMAHREPQRFARLAMRIPSTASPKYLESILYALESETPPDGLSEEAKRLWEPATAEQIEALLARLVDTVRLDGARVFCEALRRRADAHWTDETIDRLVKIATSHPHPAPGESVVEGGLDDTELIETNAINVARGMAGNTVAQLLWAHPHWLERFAPTLDALVRDHHAAVRVSAIAACVPVLNINRDRAVDWFIHACSHQDDLVLSCRYVLLLLAYASRTHFERVQPIIARMLTSTSKAVARLGAAEVTARWLVQGRMQAELEECLAGADHHRAGVAMVARELVDNRRFARGCRELLQRLFRDGSLEVRKECNRAFYGNLDLRDAGASRFLTDYVSTPAFRDDPSPLLHALGEQKGSLVPLADVVFAVCDAFAGPLAESSRDLSLGIAGDAMLIAPLLLRLYEQADGPGGDEIQQRCLDAWDRLLESRVGSIGSIASSLAK